MDRECLRAWLILVRAPGLGPVTARDLIGRFGDPVRLVSAGRARLEAAGLKADAVRAILDPPQKAIAADLAWADAEDSWILTPDDPRYPAALSKVSASPLLLFVRGDVEALSDPMLAIVGSRNPTQVGIENTRRFATRLAASGLTIASGLAIGIDGEAHAGALESGRTVAVMGTGPDLVYPAKHRDLARRIAEQGGALVTEFPTGTPAVATNFPRRNRIISGLSLGTLVTEAALKSGSLITARFAAEQGREVFAVPGSIRNPLARGCHALIKDGAKLVETETDILEELGSLLQTFVTHRTGPAMAEEVSRGRAPLDGAYLRLLDDLGHDPITADELIGRTGLPAQSIASMLLLLELEGFVASYPGGRYCRNDNNETD